MWLYLFIIVVDALTRGDEIDATSIIENLVSVAQIQPLFMKGAVEQVVGAMLTIASSSALEVSTRTMAMEVTAILCLKYCVITTSLKYSWW
jgi:hypothetical protein